MHEFESLLIEDKGYDEGGRRRWVDRKVGLLDSHRSNDKLNGDSLRLHTAQRQSHLASRRCYYIWSDHVSGGTDRRYIRSSRGHHPERYAPDASPCGCLNDYGKWKDRYDNSSLDDVLAVDRGLEWFRDRICCRLGCVWQSQCTPKPRLHRAKSVGIAKLDQECMLAVYVDV